MSDKKITIGIETTADASGAKDAKAAVDDVKDSAKDAGSALNAAGNGAGLKDIPPKAKAAAGSIDALEDEVRQLVQQLNRLPVGSQEFVTMAGKVKAAQASLASARNESAKLAGVVGRNGNAGMAVLEFSRAFEDAQYGIRGVLNNIPGLIAMLGGGPGLAGVLSVAAVAGTALWSLLSKGAEDAKEEAVDWLKIYRDAADYIGNWAADTERARGSGIDEALENEKLLADERQRGADAELKLAKQRITGDGGVAIAKARLDLSRIETQLLTASGEKALKLAKEREEALKRIVALEEQNAELIRQAELNAAQAKVNAAQEGLDKANETQGNAADRASNANAAAQRAAESIAKALEERLKTIKTLEGLRDEAQLKSSTSLSINDQLEFGKLAADLQKQINELSANPSQAEAAATVDKQQADEAAKIAAENLKKASKDQEEAAAKLRAAAEAQENLKKSQDQTRGNERDLRNIGDQSAIEQQKRAAGEQAAADITRLLEQVLAALPQGAAQDPGNQKLVGDVKALAADGIQSNEQDQVLRIVGLLVQQIKGTGEQQSKLWQAVLDAVNKSVDVQGGFQGRIDDLNRRLQNVEANLKR